MNSELSSNRRQSRVLPGFQRKLCLQFVGIAALALCAQFLFMAARTLAVTTDASEAPDQTIAEVLPGVLVEVFATSMLLFVPLLFALAVVLTKRIAGPLHGLERYLESYADGRIDRPFQTRDGDSIEGLRDALNGALQRARSEGVDAPAAEPARRAS